MLQNTWYQMGRSIVSFYVRQIMRADIQRDYPWPKGAKIIAANHPSTNDPAFVTILTREHTTILIKETLFKVPLFGRSLRMAGHVPVVCGNGRAALDEGIRLLKAGRAVMIFPEGEISPEEGFNTVHSGMARLALATGAPVIPVGIHLDKKKVRLVYTNVEGRTEVGTWYLRGPYAMTSGKPMIFHGSADDREQVRKVTGEIMQRIAQLKHHGEMRLMTRRAPWLNVAAPKATVQGAWKGTWQTFKHTAQAVGRSPLFRAAESAFIFAMMYARHFNIGI